MTSSHIKVLCKVSSKHVLSLSYVTVHYSTVQYSTTRSKCGRSYPQVLVVREGLSLVSHHISNERIKESSTCTATQMCHVRTYHVPWLAQQGWNTIQYLISSSLLSKRDDIKYMVEIMKKNMNETMKRIMKEITKEITKFNSTQLISLPETSI